MWDKIYDKHNQGYEVKFTSSFHKIRNCECSIIRLWLKGTCLKWTIMEQDLGGLLWS